MWLALYICWTALVCLCLPPSRRPSGSHRALLWRSRAPAPCLVSCPLQALKKHLLNDCTPGCPSRFQEREVMQISHPPDLSGFPPTLSSSTTLNLCNKDPDLGWTPEAWPDQERAGLTFSEGEQRLSLSLSFSQISFLMVWNETHYSQLTCSEPTVLAGLPIIIHP